MNRRTITLAGVLAAVLAIILIGALLLSADEKTGTIKPNETNRNSTQQNDTQTSDQPLITTFSTLQNTNDPRQLYDRQISFTSVKVNRVLSNTTFLFGENDTEIFATLSADLQDSPKRTLESGDILNIRGTIKKLDTAEVAQEVLNISATEAEQAAKRSYYIDVWSVDTTQ